MLYVSVLITGMHWNEHNATQLSSPR